ncbi:hypothetical protein SPRG_08311 [Saprolegnia parasitica CBS 223.65]|uniref:Uncharacterized protein n=1 Tax=Saprolegnia parasitica (strain CBS 223.65) TaxID=695850 RepID=A0A067CI82_SAPPC|nr:hypothetical protein SPRG_08311 [Saprolegnia parasitica CBS 223.65]KDO26236.1 hypothetical protein SPRG_08311 [Saprolegnia parasitica CBS 223.65]|eukprot:XP_012202945.1 hypothetical protein SPRG_08311 [Saprolegnia parasitica CBS 223.65]
MDRQEHDQQAPGRRRLRSDGPAEAPLPLRPQRLGGPRQRTEEQRNDDGMARARRDLNRLIVRKVATAQRRVIDASPREEWPALRAVHSTWASRAPTVLAMFKPHEWPVGASHDHQ